MLDRRLSELPSTVTSPDNPSPEAHLGQPIAPDKIDDGLRALWEENETATRASLMNLVIYGEQSGTLEENTRSVHRLTLEHACRVILIEALLHSSNPAQQTEAWITAHCSLGPDGRKAVCCEQLAFRLHGHSSSRLTNLLFANLDSDLPLVLWWQAPLSSHFNREIASRVDRLLIDSHLWEDNLADELNALLLSYENRSHYFVIHDLNWTRTFQLRLAIAAAFDDSRALSLLEDLVEIRIEHAPNHLSTATLLACWIEEKRSSTPNLPQIPAQTIEHACGRGPISRVVFRSRQGELCLERQPNHTFSLQQPFADVPQHFPADAVDSVGLLMSQLGRGANNAHYLRLIRRALERLACSNTSC